ncbi:MAG TPA: ATP-binding protein [Candidatus Hydrogenedentes bacterium]|nr:ATP-binding protein [Candidatus Hydrogenedentota bacterium]
MKLIRYAEIENFKPFSEKLHIDLGHPAVLIGPNNAGKTSVIQALALWSQGIKAWYAKKGQPNQKDARERISAGMNRLNILDVPVSETRYFWNGTRVRKGNKPIELVINVGIEHEDKVKDCRLIFTYRDTEIIYCKPCHETIKDDDLLKHAASLQFSLLYPMSGIMSGVSAETEETPLPDGRINMFLGQGQTAQVLRNICFKIFEQDNENKTQDWARIVALIRRMFLVDLNRPIFNETRGSLSMTYHQDGVESDLDISLAGRGLQQILLILAYLYWHKKCVLLIDEPDAHLEILRQKQVYEILRHVADENASQVVIATHSEVILDDAVDTNLTMLLNGEAVNLARQQDMKNALRSFGIEHYYKARIHPRILYVEGSTDVEMLRALAHKIGHRAADVLTKQLNTYYTCDVIPEDTLENRMDRAGGAYGNFRSHFYSVKKFVPEFKGVAIFDNDDRSRQDQADEDLAELYWQHYELENYFISPDVLAAYASERLQAAGELFHGPLLESFRSVLDRCLLERVFEGDKQQLKEFKSASTALQRTLLKTQKMSTLAEAVFQQFAQEHSQPVLLSKGEFYLLVKYANPGDIPSEVAEKLDTLAAYLEL